MKYIIIISLEVLLGTSLFASPSQHPWKQAEDMIARAQIQHTINKGPYLEYSIDALVISATCYAGNFVVSLKRGCTNPSVGPQACWEELSADEQTRLRRRALNPCIPPKPKKKA